MVVRRFNNTLSRVNEIKRTFFIKRIRGCVGQSGRFLKWNDNLVDITWIWRQKFLLFSFVQIWLQGGINDGWQRPAQTGPPYHQHITNIWPTMLAFNMLGPFALAKMLGKCFFNIVGQQLANIYPTLLFWCQFVVLLPFPISDEGDSTLLVKSWRNVGDGIANWTNMVDQHVGRMLVKCWPRLICISKVSMIPFER